MSSYAVYEPPTRNRGPADHADRFVFVRDGFNLGAFVFGPFWMIWRRLWLVLVIYLIVIGGLEYAMLRFGISSGARIAVQVLVAFLIGMEAATLRRWTLLRRGWRDCGVVIANDVEIAERRFFDARAARGSRNAVDAAAPLATAPYAPSGSGVIGLFPEPGGGG